MIVIEYENHRMYAAELTCVQHEVDVRRYNINGRALAPSVRVSIYRGERREQSCDDLSILWMMNTIVLCLG